MVIGYANSYVAETLQDDALMKKRLNPEWVRILRRRLAELESFPSFGAYLRQGTGHPHAIHELGPYGHGVRITRNVRLIVLAVADSAEAVPGATSCIVKGVADYHGKSSISWYLS